MVDVGSFYAGSPFCDALQRFAEEYSRYLTENADCHFEDARRGWIRQEASLCRSAAQGGVLTDRQSHVLVAAY